MDVPCPKCGLLNLRKYGKTRAGRQKYRCSNPGCRRQFVAGSDHLLDPKVKDRVEKLLSAGEHPVRISQAEAGVSLRWIYELRRKKYPDQGCYFETTL